MWAASTRADLLERWVCPGPEWRVSTCEVDPRAGGYRLRFGPRPAGDAHSETATRLELTVEGLSGPLTAAGPPVHGIDCALPRSPMR